MTRLQGKVAIVTGATGAIGKATARLFLEEGAKVMLVGRSLDKLEACRDELGHAGHVDCRVVSAGDEAATKAAVAATVEVFGRLDITFANAGTIGEIGPLHELTLENVNHVLQVNVVGVWLDMKYSIPPMLERGGGSIIVNSSIAGVVGVPAMAPYVTSKHAVAGLAKAAALELAETGIRVNAIAPGPIKNRLMRSLEEQMMPDDPDQMRANFTSAVPMKRYGSNEEVARLALFLASDDSSFITGMTYPIDGGYTTA